MKDFDKAYEKAKEEATLLNSFNWLSKRNLVNNEVDYVNVDRLSPKDVYKVYIDLYGLQNN